MMSYKSSDKIPVSKGKLRLIISWEMILRNNGENTPLIWRKNISKKAVFKLRKVQRYKNSKNRLHLALSQ